MSIFALEVLGIVACLAFLFFLSLVEAAFSQSSPLTLRTMAEDDSAHVPRLLGVLAEDSAQVIVPLHLGTQVCLISIAILTAHLSLKQWPVWGILYSFGIITLISLAFRQLLPRLLTQNAPEMKLVRLLAAFQPAYRILRSLALPVSATLKLSERMRDNTAAEVRAADEETTDEEIQAYLEIGEDEGIIEKEDSELIQSVVEFGDTLVREVMTPRTKIVACGERATIGELRDLMVHHRHSRIPIYRGDLDHIIGIAYIRELLSQYSRAKEGDPISGLIYPAHFVPETKPVSSLLKELQERGEHIAIVIDEFGGVSGLVTMEDLLEEIVGEIRDEDQAKASEIIEEGPRTYVMRGGTELYSFEEMVGKRYDEWNCSTVAGLIVAYLGRVPLPGEEFDLDQVRVRILDADRRRIHRLRATLPPPAGGQDARPKETRETDPARQGT